MKLLATVSFVGAAAIATAAHADSFLAKHAQLFTADEQVHIQAMVGRRQSIMDAQGIKHDAGSDPVGHVTNTYVSSGDISNLSGTDNRACIWFTIDSTGGNWYSIAYATAGSGALIDQVMSARRMSILTGTPGPALTFTQGAADPRCGNFWPLAEDIQM